MLCVVSWGTKAQGEHGRVWPAERRDKQDWQVLGADKVPGLYSEESWQEGVWNNQGVRKVYEGTDVMMG